jgi:hypothetical protein
MKTLLFLDASTENSTLIGIIVVVLLLFLIARELNCWYWKINKRVTLMEQQNKYLRALIKKMGVTDEDLKEIEKKDNSWF